MTTPRSKSLLALIALAAFACATAPRREKPPGLVPAVSFDAEGRPTIDVRGDARELVATIGSAGVTFPFERVAPGRVRATIARDLPHGTVVPYRIGEAAGELRVVRPAPDSPLTFCVLGDSGVAGSDGEAGRAQAAVARLLADERPDLVVHTGDLIYPGGEAERFDPLFFRAYAATLGRVPFFVALGNHDVKTENGAPALAALPFPHNRAVKWSSFDAGPAHFALVDSNPAAYGKGAFADTEQGRWLRQDLAQTRARWRFVAFHHPLYSVKWDRDSQRASMRRALEPLLLEAKVDLVLSGHDHFYHRTPRVLAGARNSSGLIHVTTGGGGAGLYSGDPDPSGVTASFHKAHHLVRVRIDGDRASVEAVAPGGRVLDAFTLEK